MNISVIRGDTKLFKFERKDSSGETITDTPASIFFTVKEEDLPDEFLIQKTIDDMQMDEDGVWRFTLAPEDTDEMEVGTYKFDIQITSQEGVKTTVAIGAFRVTEEVTFASNEV